MMGGNKSAEGFRASLFRALVAGVQNYF